MRCWKKILLATTAMALVVTGHFITDAEETTPGGYSYLDAAGKIDLTAYFDVKGADMQLQDESLDFVMNGKEATVSFKKHLLGSGFALAFSGIEGNTLDRIEVELKDVENAEEVATCCVYSMSDTSSIVKIANTQRPIMINGSFYKENNSDFYVRYDEEANQFTDGTSYYLPIIESMDGKIFEGFSSHTVNLTIRLYGENGSVFRLTELNRQRMGKLYSEDTEAPVMTIIDKITNAEVGSTIMLPKAIALDVLADCAKVTMSVNNSDMDYVEAVGGTRLMDVSAEEDYKITLNETGRYRVTYQATDGKNASQQVLLQIVVTDHTAPNITLREELPTSGKVGTILELPEVLCEDNLSEPEMVKQWITVKYPNGVIMETGNSVELSEEGLYEITFSAIDETGNIGRHTAMTYAESEE